MLGVELLECATAQKEGTVAYGPKRDVQFPQFADIEGVNALGWRELMHVAKMLFKELAYLGHARIFDCDLHGLGEHVTVSETAKSCSTGHVKP
jgi:hypothetical protein